MFFLSRELGRYSLVYLVYSVPCGFTVRLSRIETAKTRRFLNLHKMQFHVVQPNIISTRSHCLNRVGLQSVWLLSLPKSLWNGRNKIKAEEVIHGVRNRGTCHEQVRRSGTQWAERVLWARAGRCRDPVVWDPGSGQLTDSHTGWPGERAQAPQGSHLAGRWGPLPSHSQPQHLLWGWACE